MAAHPAQASTCAASRQGAPPRPRVVHAFINLVSLVYKKKNIVVCVVEMLEESSPRSSVPSEVGGRSTLRFSMPGFGYGSFNALRSFLSGVRKGSGRLKSLRQSLTSGAPKTAFAEDLKSYKTNIFDPQDKLLFQMNWFRTAYVAPSSRVFATGELVIDPMLIAKRYFKSYFAMDFVALLPLPQNVGTLWYFLTIQREDSCWHQYCDPNGGCNSSYLYCNNNRHDNYEYDKWLSSTQVFNLCNGTQPDPFNFGIYQQALVSGILGPGNFISKLCYCFWWGLQNLSTLGQGLSTSIYPGEVLFSIFICVLGLILFALLIGNMQSYLQSVAIRLEEMRVKKRDAEQWMHHRSLPPDIRQRVRRYERYRWLETRGVDEESLVQTLPKDLRRDIKRHLCLGLVKRVPLFENMDERLLDAICERLRPALYTENEFILREGDPVDEMHFILHGCLESVTTDGGRSGFFNKVQLKEGSFCGDELLTWALDPKSGANFPASSRTVKALTEVEAFALCAEELKFVASQFRRLHSRQVQHTFRFYSQQWRTWAACFIQAAWRRYYKRKMVEQRRKEEEAASRPSSSHPSLGATIYASRFAANAMRGIHRLRSKAVPAIVRLPKPPEPDFGVDDAD
ncbi:hypothetical protein C2845_PM16G21680 [Panicum miliaceum]|uniref:Cyclic nucleotide-binding domain-containing protein n=1 Tax=Panicum miliaceum TaxID=4540 RepID=A0A3L6PWA6_PANMI|nr:hypothetical protein C2845_PM16G21680 [Panicum miliaceum]